ncbi:MAG: PP2C family protein-serine/threonine phosphatase [Planctomycetota bacterium]|nr:PP2C family protein-serine/threonine phosphatase [Planctomycetota bacterium]
MDQRERLASIVKRIQAERELESSLVAAKKQQLHMLPDPPQVPGLEFGAYYSPSSQLGGDFYDFVDVGPDEVGTAIGDVSGHGIPAALVMGMTKKTINIFGRGVSSSAATLAHANADLHKDFSRGFFVTVLYTVFNRRTQTLNFCRAGHPPLILANPNRKPQMEVFEPRGLAMGIDDGRRFNPLLEEKHIQLIKGDLIFLYTDGLWEATNRDREEYGKKRIENTILRNVDRPMDEIIQALEVDVYTFMDGREQEDDITMVGFRVK